MSWILGMTTQDDDRTEITLKKTIPSKDYSVLRKAVERELLAGVEHIRRTYQQEVVRRTWNIGKLLREQLGLADEPSAENAALINKLSRDLNRSDSFFYDAAKFHRSYPKKPPLALSWSHYSLLIRIEDPKERFGLERKAVKESINAKALRMLTRSTFLNPGLHSETRKLSVERGSLYHYRASKAPADGRILIDIGFGIERQIRCNEDGSLHSGLIVRANREGEEYSAKIAPFEKARLYTYAATVERVIDGDTVLARIDLGFRSWITQTFRLRGIDAPEVTCAAGLKAKAEVRSRMEACPRLILKSYKQDKYGRYLADVFYLPGSDDREKVLREGIFLNQQLLDEGLAVPYDGSDRLPLSQKNDSVEANACALVS